MFGSPTSFICARKHFLVLVTHTLPYGGENSHKTETIFFLLVVGRDGRLARCASLGPLITHEKFKCSRQYLQIPL